MKPDWPKIIAVAREAQKYFDTKPQIKSVTHSMSRRRADKLRIAQSVQKPT